MEWEPYVLRSIPIITVGAVYAIADFELALLIVLALIAGNDVQY